MKQTSSHILRIDCADQPGIVAAVTECLFRTGGNIEDAAQFNDPLSGHFFMRVMFTGDVDAFTAAFKPLAAAKSMEWRVTPVEARTKTLILVSKEDHCLHDLLYHARTGFLKMDIVGVGANHQDARAQVEHEGIPFHYVASKDEKALAALVDKSGAELIVLARYMQILSSDFCARYPGRIINIHHSFLPGFKGARPYHQAYARGVKIIGATAHFVTQDLDEGPIIEQDTVRVDHSMQPEKLKRVGQGIETRVLRQALEYYTERRIFLHGHHTVIL